MVTLSRCPLDTSSNNPAPCGARGHACRVDIRVDMSVRKRFLADSPTEEIGL